jgi:hypothetical protein
MQEGGEPGVSKAILIETVLANVKAIPSITLLPPFRQTISMNPSHGPFAGARSDESIIQVLARGEFPIASGSPSPWQHEPGEPFFR